MSSVTDQPKLTDRGLPERLRGIHDAVFEEFMEYIDHDCINQGADEIERLRGGLLCEAENLRRQIRYGGLDTHGCEEFASQLTALAKGDGKP